MSNYWPTGDHDSGPVMKPGGHAPARHVEGDFDLGSVCTNKECDGQVLERVPPPNVSSLRCPSGDKRYPWSRQ